MRRRRRHFLVIRTPYHSRPTYFTLLATKYTVVSSKI